MKPFAFLCPTPEWAKRNGCGQYNGYLAFPASMWDALVREDEDGWTGYRLAPKVDGLWCEVTYSRPYATLDKFGPIVPVTAIPEEAVDGEPICVFGYDTCHSWNSWEENTLENEKNVTREWLRLSLEELAEE